MNGYARPAELSLRRDRESTEYREALAQVLEEAQSSKNNSGK